MEIIDETSSLTPQLLQKLIEELQRELSTTKAELNTYQKRCEQYAQAYEQMQHQLKELLRYRYGKKSERFIDDEQPQLNLFDITSSPVLATESEETKILISNVAHSQRKSSKVEKVIPTRIEVIPVSDADKQCTCGLNKMVMRYETKTLIHHQHAIYKMVEQRREVVACPKGCDNNIVIAPAPLHILPKVKAT